MRTEMDKWMQAFSDCGVDPKWYAQRERGRDEIFPWDFIDAGVTKRFLLREWKQAAEEKERKLQRVTLAIQDRFGKNAMLKGTNLMEGGTTIDRNGQIGGHKAGDE